LAAFSLLLWLIIVGWWVRSYFVGDNISFSWSQDDGKTWASQRHGIAIEQGGLYCYEITSGPLTGELYVNVHRGHLNYPPGWLWVQNKKPSDPRQWNPPRSKWEYLGFIHQQGISYSQWMNDRASHWILPIWLPAMLVTLPLLPMAFRLRRRSRGSGHCQQCGYDLRATLDRCPECGMVPKEIQNSD